MESTEVIRQIKKLAILALDRKDLEKLLDDSDTIRADDTCVAGWIRILTLGGHVLVQEEAPEGDVLIRRFDSHETAERFVEQRLATYERMWDGCGCKIDYQQEPESD